MAPRSSSGCSSSSLSALSVGSPASPASPGAGSVCVTDRCSRLWSFPGCLPHGPCRPPSPRLPPSRPSLSVTRRLLQSRRTRPERFDLNIRQPRQFWMCPVGPVRVPGDATSIYTRRARAGVCARCAQHAQPVVAVFWLSRSIRKYSVMRCVGHPQASEGGEGYTQSLLSDLLSPTQLSRNFCQPSRQAFSSPAHNPQTIVGPLEEQDQFTGTKTETYIQKVFPEFFSLSSVNSSDP